MEGRPHPCAIPVFVRGERQHSQPRYLCDWPMNELDELLRVLHSRGLTDSVTNTEYTRFRPDKLVLTSAMPRFEILASY